MSTIEEAGNLRIAGLPSRRPEESGSTSQVYLVKFYLAVFSMASKNREPSGGFMRKHLSSRVKMTWLLPSFSWDIQSEKRT